MNSGLVRLDQIMFILLIMNKYHLMSLLLRFVLHMPNVNHNIIDQRQLLTIFRRVLCEIPANLSNLLAFKNWPINQRRIKPM